MEVLKIGSEGEKVVTLQTLLRGKGHIIHIDGVFGNDTEDVVIEYQKKNYLNPDGVVGKNTWDSLYKTNSNSKSINDTKFVLTTKHYYKTSYEKTGIVLHHTNGWVVQKGTKDTPSMNHFHWWTSTDKHVSTAFSIDYKGNIYQHFDPKYWAYHLGVNRSDIEKQTIGIELANEGGMTKNQNGGYHWYSNKVAIAYNRTQDKPYYSEEKWRGYNYYAPYSKEQVESTKWLVKYLCEKYNINKNIITDYNYHPELLNEDFKGIYHHANIRIDKLDLSPAFPLQEIKNFL